MWMLPSQKKLYPYLQKCIKVVKHHVCLVNWAPTLDLGLIKVKFLSLIHLYPINKEVSFHPGSSLTDKGPISTISESYSEPT